MKKIFNDVLVLQNRFCKTASPKGGNLDQRYGLPKASCGCNNINRIWHQKFRTSSMRSKRTIYLTLNQCEHALGYSVWLIAFFMSLLWIVVHLRMLYNYWFTSIKIYHSLFLNACCWSKKTMVYVLENGNCEKCNHNHLDIYRDIYKGNHPETCTHQHVMETKHNALINVSKKKRTSLIY